MGLAPTDADLTQVAKAVQTIFQKSTPIVAAAGGTADTITAAYTPAIEALTDGMTLYVRAASANTAVAPTFTPRTGAGAIAAKPIVKGNNLPLVAGDIVGAGYRMALQYDLTLDKWVLLNPATGVTAQQQKQIQSITATVAANALTLGLNPTTLDFRAAALTNGVPNTRTLAAAASLVVPSGATLGTVSGAQARLALLAIDNAGTVELAVVNLAGGNNLDETTLISTTAISAAANSAGTIYSAAARANVPFRVVGYVDITQAAAGTWATAPTVIQGQGGQALAALSSLGYGQTWQDVKASRALNTNYVNTTGKPIAISVGGGNGTSTPHAIFVMVGGVQIYGSSYNVNGTATTSVFAIIPPGATYSVGGTAGTTSIYTWAELR